MRDLNIVICWLKLIPPVTQECVHWIHTHRRSTIEHDLCIYAPDLAETDVATIPPKNDIDDADILSSSSTESTERSSTHDNDTTVRSSLPEAVSRQRFNLVRGSVGWRWTRGWNLLRDAIRLLMRLDPQYSIPIRASLILWLAGSSLLPSRWV